MAGTPDPTLPYPTILALPATLTYCTNCYHIYHVEQLVPCGVPAVCASCGPFRVKAVMLMTRPPLNIGDMLKRICNNSPG